MEHLLSSGQFSQRGPWQYDLKGKQSMCLRLSSKENQDKSQETLPPMTTNEIKLVIFNKPNLTTLDLFGIICIMNNMIRTKNLGWKHMQPLKLARITNFFKTFSQKTSKENDFLGESRKTSFISDIWLSPSYPQPSPAPTLIVFAWITHKYFWNNIYTYIPNTRN